MGRKNLEEAANRIQNKNKITIATKLPFSTKVYQERTEIKQDRSTNIS